MDFYLQMLERIQALRTPFFDRFFISITVLGEEYFSIAILCLILWCVNKKLGYRIGFAYLTSWILNFSIKAIFHIQRPFTLNENIRPLRPETATGYSFPSGHTQSISSIGTAAAVSFRKKWIYITGAVLIILIAASRMYLGVHTLLDVAVGAVTGIAWVFAADYIFAAAGRLNKKALLLLMYIPMAAAMAFIRDNDFYKIAGTFTSFLIGYLIDDRYIRYDTKGALLQQIMKFIFGIAVLLAIKSIAKRVLGESLLADYIRYLIIGFWITTAAPLLFKAVFKPKAAELKHKT